MRVASSVGQNTRRSQRLSLRVPVRIEWSTQGGGCLTVETATVVISAHGALVRLPWMVPLGQELKVENIATREQQNSTVAYVAVLENGEFAVGVSFSQPNPKFWRVSFPPADWTPGYPDTKADP